MGFFKDIIKLFKKPPPVPRLVYDYGYDHRTRTPSDGEIIQAQNDFLEQYKFTDEEILDYRRRAKIFYNGNWYNIYPTEIRKRIPVNKDIDPFEEEIWYEDELKTN